MRYLALSIVVLFFSSCCIRTNGKRLTKTGLDEEITLKVASLKYQSNQKIDIVYGVDDTVSQQKYSTELHFNIGGNPNCKERTLISSIDFGENEIVMLPDSMNEFEIGAGKFVKRERLHNEILYTFKHDVIGINLFFIERIDLQPDEETNQVRFRLKSRCKNYFDFLINLTKYEAENVNNLIDKHVALKLNSLSDKQLDGLRVIFSFNDVIVNKGYKADMVDQSKMLILFYDEDLKSYVITDSNNQTVRKIKRNT